MAKHEKAVIQARSEASYESRDQISCAAISAVTGEGVETLMDVIEEKLSRKDQVLTVLLPPTKYDVRAWLHQNGHIISEDMRKNGDCELKVQLTDVNSGRFLTRHAEFII